MRDPILDDLNDAQREAVTFGTGPLMVLAGAGSGKTRVITRRIARLLRDGERAHAILALTFTNKAAGEMARRVQELGGERVMVATFHSACARFLRQDAELLGYPRDFSIYDTQDRDSVLKLLMGEHGLDGSGIKPAQLGRRLSQLKNLCTSKADLVFGYGAVDKVLQRLWDPYHAALQRLGALDFDDLLGRFRDLLLEHPDARERYQQRFRWLLVDEFQDTNRVQYELLRLLVGAEQNLCVVGDPDQSIYRFRGAEIRNILDFQRDFPGTTVVRLEDNYRSTRTILRAAEGVIENNHERLEKRLRTDNDEGDAIVVFAAASPAEEARAIARRAGALVAKGVAPDAIAVFYRSHFLSRGLEEAFRNELVPYAVVGGVSFFERKEVKDVLAYLRVLVNPLDDVSMERVINVPPRGIGRATLDKLRTGAAARGLSLYEGLLDDEARAELPAKARTTLAALAAAFQDARGNLASAHATMRAIERGIGYIAHLQAMGDQEDEARVENVLELLSDAAYFDEAHGGGLAEYLGHVALMTSEDRREADEPRVSLMTVHAAKGLEFDHVFVAGLEEGVFPHSRALEEAGGVEEERRLLYVALTRARQTLWLGHARERMVGGLTERTQRSSFLKEIPRDCITGASAATDEADADDEDFAAFGDGGHGAAVEYDQTDPAEQFAPGARVAHHEYGPGTLLRLRGSGILARATVRFDTGQERELLMEYARLRPLGRGTT
ncbi:MAG: UvrD-helicase domain-containing protein [Planctomycetes bacterium]|nr:UvrD-helicase domain-containing protein [Planctomycetota bacterium]